MEKKEHASVRVLKGDGEMGEEFRDDGYERGG